MKNRYILRKYVAILALVVSAIVFLPEALFGKGAVIGYVYGYGNNSSDNVSDDQLNRLTHIMAVDLYPDANGYLHSASLSNSCK